MSNFLRKHPQTEYREFFQKRRKQNDIDNIQEKVAYYRIQNDTLNKLIKCTQDSIESIGSYNLELKSKIEDFK